MNGLLAVLLPVGGPPEEPDDVDAHPPNERRADRHPTPAPAGSEPRSAATSKHGKELLASHRLPAHTPSPRTWKPLLAGLLMIIVAGGGFIYSGLYIAIPESPWVSGSEGHIYGHVNYMEDQNKTPLANATVSVGDREARTNDTGYFDLHSVGTGQQAIVIEAPGYRQLRWRTVITGGNPLEYSFVLTEVNASDPDGNGPVSKDDVGNLNTGFYGCGALMMIFTAVILLGALFCFQRMRYPLATTGAILSFSVGYFQVYVLFDLIIPYGIIFSLASVILLLFSRGEFA